MAIAITSTFNSNGIIFSGGVATQSLTFSASCTLIVVATMGDNGDDPTSVKYNGVNLTQAVANDGSFVSTGIWYLLAPATGSAHNLVITYPGNRSGGFTCWELTGTATSSPIGATGGIIQSGSTTSISTSITAQRANSLLLNCAGGGTPTTTMSASNGETRDMNANGNGSIRVTTAHLALTTVTSYTTGYTYGAMSNTVLSVVEVMTPPTTVNYTLTAAQGSFTETGFAAALKKGWEMVSAKGSFTLTGFSATLVKGHSMTAAFGSFVLTGFSANLTSARRIVAAFGSFTLTGISATIKKVSTITAALGTFTLTGFAAGLGHVRTMVAALGTFVLTGEATAFKKSWKMVAAQGSFTLTYFLNSISHVRKMTAAYGSFVLTGFATRLSHAYNMIAAKASFILRGFDVRFLFDGESTQWRTLTKSISSFTNAIKNLSIWTNQDRG